MTDASTPLVRVVDARKEYGSTVAVADVSLAIGRGEVVGLIGANGAGKSTLMKMILGLVRPTGGRVELFGVPPSRHGRRRLGYVPQGLGLYPDLTARENAAFVADAFGVTMRPFAPDLADVADRLVGDLSLGYRRRIAFHVATSHDPELLVLDEPTSGVGPVGRARLWEAIDATAASGVGVLVSTHHMAEAEQCDRVVVMAGGRVLAQGATAELCRDVDAVAVTGRARRAAYDALDMAGLHVSMAGPGIRVGGVDAAGVRRVLDEAGVRLDAIDVATVPATFDEAFVALVATERRGRER